MQAAVPFHLIQEREGSWGVEEQGTRGEGEERGRWGRR